MNRINVLTDETSNKIAAGEVVERPFSVVKELVENSIDAQAKNISIEILDGGQKGIKVIDDGTGIHPDDIEKAFLPHATSKIKDVSDIYKIDTLGFRGEALPSIAAVSNTVLRSRVSEFNFGKEIRITGGVIHSISDTGFNTGTSIEVNDIFYNVPARLKFLKSSSREAALISDIIGRIALANPDVSFKLLSNEKKIINTYGNGNSFDVIRSIYGKTICDNLIYFENHSDIASVHGYIGNAEASRGSRNNQSIFVNKRHVKNKLITAAVENAFKSFLTVNKFPFFILNLDIFPEFIDVNIHPTKAEIKFMDDREIFKLVFDGIHKALRMDLKDTFDIPAENRDYYNTPKYEEISYLDKNSTAVSEVSRKEVELPIDLISSNQSVCENYSDGSNAESDNAINNTFSTKEYKYENNNFSQKLRENNANNNSILANNAKTEAKFPPLSIIGQFNRTYILCEAMGELFIIDQHAAHEKVLFEKYRKNIENDDIAVQILMNPVVIELSSEDFMYYIENQAVFSKAGFVIEIFGDNTITIREVPYILGKLDVKALLVEIIDNLKNMGSGKTIDVKYDSIATMACKSAIKANHTLTNAEISTLIDELRFSEDPFNCPHGRPTIIKITLLDLEKKFKRVQ